MIDIALFVVKINLVLQLITLTNKKATFSRSQLCISS